MQYICPFCLCGFSVFQVGVALGLQLKASGLLFGLWRPFISHLKSFFSSKLMNSSFDYLNLVTITTHVCEGGHQWVTISIWFINKLHLTCDPNMYTKRGSKTQVSISKMLQPKQRLNTVDSPPMLRTDNAFQMRGLKLKHLRRLSLLVYRGCSLLLYLLKT